MLANSRTSGGLWKLPSTRAVASNVVAQGRRALYLRLRLPFHNVVAGLLPTESMSEHRVHVARKGFSPTRFSAWRPGTR